MKKIIKTIFFIIYFLSSLVFAKEDNIVLENTEKDDFEKPIILEPEEYAPETKEENPYTKEALKGILTKEYDLNSTTGMFKDQLTFKFKRAPIQEVTNQFNIYSTLTEEIPEKNKGNLKYNPKVINYLIYGKFRGGHEKFNILTDFTPYHENFFHKLILDAYVETDRIPHHSVIFGTSRSAVGYEGGISPYLVPTINRSQTARNFGVLRKTGLRLKGDFKYIDYDIGGYSSDTYYSEFFPGVETDLWINFKPFAKFDNKKIGTLNVAGGIQIGNRNGKDFKVTSAAIRYNYKKIAFTSEFQYADGSNGYSGLTEDVRWGYNTTLVYKLTKKLHLVARFDDFNNNVDIKHNNTREYTTGINYYILGLPLRVMLNYVYCQNMGTSDSHKIILGSHILL